MHNLQRCVVSFFGLLMTVLMAVACNNETSKVPTVEPADLVLINGGIYTVDSEHGWAQAVAVRNGLIVSVGSNLEMQGRIAMR